MYNFHKQEEEFLFKHFDINQTVLEYGSGESSIEIAKMVKYLITVEHDKRWYNEIHDKLPFNVTAILEPPAFPINKTDDGTYEQFEKYINAPMLHKPFDIIFIDGRARVGCASICHKLAHKNTIVFIHDFDREIYQPVLSYLDLIEQVRTLGKFEIKNSNQLKIPFNV